MKKHLALILASLVLCGLAIVPAFAGEEPNAKGSPIETAEQLASACANGGDYYLSKSVELNRENLGNGSFHVKSALNLDMNGKYITLCANGSNIDTIPFIVDDKASLTINRSTPTAVAGGINQKEGTKLTCSLIKVEGSGSLTLRHNITGISCATRFGMIEMNGATNTLTIDGANIIQCANTDGSIVCMNSGSLKFTSGAFDSCVTKDGFGRAASPLTVGTDSADAPTATATISEAAYFSNCESSTENIPSGSAISVCGNGKVEFAGLIQDCKSGKYGAAICLSMDAEFKMNGGSIKGGSSASYGAVYVGLKETHPSEPYRYGSFTMNGGEIGDDIDSIGSTIYVGYAGSFRLNAGTIPAAKKATQGGCFTVAAGGKLLTAGGTIKGYDQASMFKGGCIYSAGDVQIYQCTIDGNGAEVTQGGLIYQTQDTRYRHRSTIKLAAGAQLKNGAAYDSATGEKGQGGAVYVENGTLTIDGLGSVSSSGCIIENCTADSAGGAVYLKAGRLEMGRDSLISNCHAAYTSASKVTNADHVSYGGAIYIESGEVSLQNGNIEQCSTESTSNAQSSGHGGGIYVQSFSLFETANAFDISQCSTQGNGGGICFGAAAALTRSATAKMDAVRIFNCNAANGGAIWAGNGGSFAMNLRTSGCSASECGAGAYFMGCAISLKGSITNGKAKTCGGVYVARAANAAATGETSLAIAGKLEVSSNTSADGKNQNLFLDYLGECSATPVETATPFAVDIAAMDQSCAVTLAITDRALAACANHVLVLSPDKWALKSCFTLESANQRLCSDDGGHALMVADTSRLITTADDYKAARTAGGEYFLTQDLDLSSDEQAVGQPFAKDLTLNLQGHWITLNTNFGIGFDVTGSTLRLGTAKSGDTPAGGIRGTVRTLSRKSTCSTLIKVNANASAQIAANIQNVGDIADTNDGAVLTVCAGEQQATCVSIEAGTISQCFDSMCSPIKLARNTKLTINGGTIEGIANARYGTCISLGKESVLEAENSHFTAAAGSSGAGCIIGEANTVATFKNCTFTGSSTETAGCLWFQRGSKLTLDGCTLKGGSANDGGAIVIEKGELNLCGDTTISACKASDKGGAIWATDSVLTFNSASITDCSAGGGGALCLEACQLNANGLEIASCTATENGAGICLLKDDSHTVALENCVISQCVAGKSGGGICSNQQLTVNDSTIENCSASEQGGGIALNSGSLSMAKSNRIVACQAKQGGGICIAKTSKAIDIAADTTITECKAQENGGGICIAVPETDATRTIACTLEGNTAGALGGGIAYTASEKSILNLSGTISGNTATQGGGISLAGGSATIAGDINRNKATQAGGGIAYGDTSRATTLTLGTGCKITLNTSDGKAGGVWAPQISDYHAKLVLSGNVRIVNNTAQGTHSNLYLATSKPASSQAIYGSQNASDQAIYGSQRADDQAIYGSGNDGDQAIYGSDANDDNAIYGTPGESESEDASAAAAAYAIDATAFTGTTGVSLDAAGVTTWPYAFASATKDAAAGFIPDSTEYNTGFDAAAGAATISKNGGGESDPDDSVDPVDPDDPADPGNPDNPDNPSGKTSGKATPSTAGLVATGDTLGTFIPIIIGVVVVAAIVLVVAVIRNRKQ